MKIKLPYVCILFACATLLFACKKNKTTTKGADPAKYPTLILGTWQFDSTYTYFQALGAANRITIEKKKLTGSCEFKENNDFIEKPGSTPIKYEIKGETLTVGKDTWLIKALDGKYLRFEISGKGEYNSEDGILYVERVLRR